MKENEHGRATASQQRQYEYMHRSLAEGLENLKGLGDFISGIEKRNDLVPALDAANIQLKSFVPFRSVAFLVVDPGEFSFSMKLCDPKSDTAAVLEEVEHQVQEGVFGWALQQNHAKVFPGIDDSNTILLHPLNWNNRTFGMMVGTVAAPEISISATSMAMISIICYFTAAAVHSLIIDGNVDTALNAIASMQA
jgi:hypothetical protein